MVTTAKIAAGAAALAAVGLLGTACSGSGKVESKSAPSISAADLQKQIADQFAGTDTRPKSITCSQDLVGEVGKTASCDVVFSDTNSVEAVVKSKGGTDFDISPALTKDQLAKAVSELASTPTVTCDSGLAGNVGEMATCEVTVNGQASKQAVMVDGVNGLQLDLSMAQLVPKERVQEVLMQKLAADGKPVETVDCVSDAPAKLGSAVECVTVTGSEKKGYDVTVTTVEGDNVDLDYKDKP